MAGAAMLGQANQAGETAEVDLVAVRTRRIGARLEYVRMGFGMPQRSRGRHRQLRRLEGEQAELRGILHSLGRSHGASSRSRAIGWITPQPFPSEHRAVSAEQRRITSRVMPIG